VEYVAQALKQTSREAIILLYAPALDPHLQKMTELDGHHSFGRLLVFLHFAMIFIMI
jgi:hypothetical protein